MANALLNLLTWFSPAFPTGGFAYSAGLEWVVEQGGVNNETTLALWLEDSLALGSLWTDAVLFRRAYAGEDVADLALALCPGAERRLETSAQGEAFCAAALPWGGAPAAPYPVAGAKLASVHGIPVDDALLAYLHAAVAGQISAAVRLIPLGQSAGLRAQKALEPAIRATVHQSQSLELGSASWAADIAGQKHETQYTRLFRT
ncbi:urease accessory protein UreF [Acidocella aquatica]|uniref:Urease accessory protein UreF n=1 Tax=Acidocella aquatica TaxID=1922313 RepID=A0ABQ6AEZ7_9PROT|nr:urease accessory UreF family protein [Acidocella aquatica]GLR68615.1 urease accessory protein UreF [Acidocella aquatica]